MSFLALIVAAGSGLRAGPGAPKTWRSLAGKPVIRWSVEAFSAAGASKIIVIVAPERLADVESALHGLEGWTAVAGGKSRVESVAAGLAAVEENDDGVILIHDAARPFVTPVHIHRLIAGLGDAPGALLALPVADTLKRGAGEVEATVSRDGLWRAQTPQVFRLGALRRAHAAWPADEDPTDDAAMIERAGGRIVLVPGDPILMKLTYPEDFQMAEQLAGARRIVRIGQGVDAHRFGPGDAVWLCGVRIPHSHGLVGHSDADCALHAVTDAVLGAMGDGDIGQHFPPSDSQWKGAASERFLRHAVDRAVAAGAEILSADVTLICERPKVGPYREAMRARLADLLGLPVARVSVKATTTEGMGFTGREEGLMAQAVVTVEAPR